MNKYILTALFGFLLSSSAFSQIKVGTALLPLSYLIQSIGGDKVVVETALGAGQNPHTFSITPKKMSALLASDIYFSIHFPMEQKITRTLKSTTKVVDISTQVKRLPMLGHHQEHHDQHEHRQGDHRDHQDDQPDPHIWFNPQNLKLLSTAILEALKTASPADSAIFSENYKKLVKNLDQLIGEIDQRLMKLSGKKILIYHPSIQYLTAAYNIQLLPVEIEGKEPTAKQLGAVIATARESQAKSILIDSHQDSRQIARIIQLLKVEEIKLYPLDYQIIDAIRNAASAIAKIEGQNATH